jgi:MoxR-like ATPase
MDEERLVIRQNLKGSYEKVNQVVSSKFYAQEGSTWMKNRKYILDIVFATVSREI